MMGTFDEWQAQKDSQYILSTQYLQELASQHNSTIEATANYLLHCNSLKEIYEKLDDGEYYTPYHNFDYPHPLKEFLDNAKYDARENNNNLSIGFIEAHRNYYFKKSELPAIEPVATNQPQAGEIKPHDDPMELGENQKLMRYFETFTPHDLACFIVDYNPAYNQNDDDFNKAYLLVSKAVNAGVLKPNTQNEIPKEQVKQYLKSLDWIYKDFNDNLPPATDDKIGHATITQTMPTDSQLSQKVADLNAQLASATDTIASLQEKLQQSNFDRLESYHFNTAELHRAKTELNQYQKENESLKAKIAELQANEPSQSDTVSNDKLLSNVELNNLKKAVIAENNRQIATILKSMDIRGELSKDDLLQVIRPNMESMAKVLNGENSYKALLVVDNTIKDNHLKSLSFQTGRKTKEQTEKKSIQLIFDREKPPITEN